MLLIAAIALITLDFRDGGASPAHAIGRGRVRPRRAHARVTDPSPASSTAQRRTVGEKVASLQQQNDQLSAELAQAQVTTQEQAS